jgi:CheY-like chemotaxis protein
VKIATFFLYTVRISVNLLELMDMMTYIEEIFQALRRRSDGKNMDKILIVEDDPIFMEILKIDLKDYEDKFEVVTAEDGKEAIEAVKDRTVSLVVTELDLPESGGFEILQYIHENMLGIPCVIMTTSSKEEAEKKLKQDVLYVLEKPFDADELARVVMTALERNMLTLDAAAVDTDGNRTGGFLRGISVGSFLQMIEMEEKTCLFEVSWSDEEKGLFYFEAGQLCDAVYGPLVGREAALKMIPLERPKIRFLKVPDKKIRRRIDEPLMGLIMEGMRRQDETAGKK